MKKKVINLLDKDKNQLYFYFNELSTNKINEINNIQVTNKKSKITVRWFDFYKSKNYKKGMKLKTILKRALLMIISIIKQKKLKNTLNGSGFSSISIKNNNILVEPQFS